MNYIEFSAKIKEKYPEYKDVDDLVLAQKIVEKYPEYKEKVTFEEVKKEPVKKGGIDLTPSGLAKQNVMNNAAMFETPIRAIKNKQSLTDAYNDIVKEQQEKYNNSKSGGVADFAIDMLGYSQLPFAKGGGAVNFGKNALVQGGIPGALEGLKREGTGGIVGGGGYGAGIAAALQGIAPQAGKVINKVLESNAVQKGLPKVLEGLTSVPSDYSQRALEKELAGQSILGGKFNADTAYIPIEQKLRQAKEMLPTSADFGNEYYNLGQKAVKGMENLEEKAANDIVDALEPLNDKEIQNGGLQNAVNTIINSFGKGGVYNSAKARAKNVINFLDENLNKEGLTLRDLHRIKEDLYDIGYSEAGQKNGVGAKVARGVANQINNYLRGVSPSYAKPNDVYALIKDVTRGLDGQTTIGNKISEIGSTKSAKTGLDKRLKDIDMLLPAENKFYKNAQDIIESENEINNIINTVGKQYERNPRLLANRTDEGFENAINDLQKKTNVNFMDELNDIRAREALEKFFPGQGGGSGSSQGFGNLLRTALIGGSPVAAVTMHNPAALLGLAAVSPKLTAKGTIKNIGKISDIAQKAAKGAYNDALNRLTQLGAKGAANMLYGGVEYNNYK